MISVGVKVASHPKCDHFGKKTSNFDKKKKLFLREVMDEKVFSSLIAFNRMLTIHCDNLSTRHYHITYYSLFRHAIMSHPDHEHILRCCRIFQKKSKSDRATLLYQRDR